MGMSMLMFGKYVLERRTIENRFCQFLKCFFGLLYLFFVNANHEKLNKVIAGRE